MGGRGVALAKRALAQDDLDAGRLIAPMRDATLVDFSLFRRPPQGEGPPAPGQGLCRLAGSRSGKPRRRRWRRWTMGRGFETSVHDLEPRFSLISSLCSCRIAACQPKTGRVCSDTTVATLATTVPAPAKLVTMICRNSQTGASVECGTPNAVDGGHEGTVALGPPASRRHLAKRAGATPADQEQRVSPCETAACRIGSGLPGCIAQLVEQLTLNQRVVGSIPTAPTIFFSLLGFMVRSETPPFLEHG